MQALLRWLGYAVAGVVAALLLVWIVARQLDGPVGFFQGGAFRSGELVGAQVDDWSFASDIAEIELQLLEPPHSRTTWILVDGERAFVPCGMPEFRLWKQWPHQALVDGRALVRIDGRIHAVQLVREEDPSLRQRLTAQIAEKYGTEVGVDLVWLFRLDAPRG